MALEYDKTLPAGSSRSGQDWALNSSAEEPEQEFLTDPTSKFELLNPLGRGSYGSVYKARIIESGDIVAVKIIPLTEQDEMESIQKEIAMLRDCNHPNIVRYYGSWRAPEALWIAMEYCAGGSVSDIMHACSAPLEEPVISYICGETLAGLVYLHALGRVHRDIKCGNILLTDTGEVKLADFGVAAQLTSTLSKRNTFIGTPHWMAPEVIQASHYDGKVDIWALGISSIEMAERYPPRWRVNPNRVIFMVVRDPPPRLSEQDRWTLAFQDFIAQCLAKDARSRPTARYLQQHKFIKRDRAVALRALMPLVHQATLEYAALAEPAVAPPPGTGASGGGGGGDDGYFSWRHQQQQQQQQQQQHAAIEATVLAGAAMRMQQPPPSPHLAAVGDSNGMYAAGTVVQRPSSAGAAAAVASSPSSQPSAGALASGVSGTFILHDSDNIISNARSGGSSSASGFFPADSTSLPSRQYSAVSDGGGGILSAQSEASVDYLAAVQSAAVAGGHLADFDSVSPDPQFHQLHQNQQQQQQYKPGGWSPSGDRGGGGGRSNYSGSGGVKGEMNRIAERLYNIHSSGEVVPLPFLQATDLAPLALLGLQRNPAADVWPHLMQRSSSSSSSNSGLPDWKGALREVLVEAQSGQGDGNYQDQDLDPLGQLSPALVTRIQASPVLLNLASALASHKAALAEQKELGAPLRVQQPTKFKAEELADTLRAILCL